MTWPPDSNNAMPDQDAGEPRLCRPGAAFGDGTPPTPGRAPCIREQAEDPSERGMIRQSAALFLWVIRSILIREESDSLILALVPGTVV